MKIKNRRHKQSNKLEGIGVFSYSVYDSVAYELCDQAKTKMTELYAEVSGRANQSQC